MARWFSLSLLTSLTLFGSACIIAVPVSNQPGATPSPGPTAVPTAFPTVFPTSANIPSATPMPLPTPTVPVPIPSAVPAAPAGFTDLFEQSSNLTTSWVIEDAPAASEGPSNWRIQNGLLLQSSNIYFTNPEVTLYEGTNAITRQGPWQNMRLSVKIKPTDNDGIGVMFRYQNPDNYYRFYTIQDPSNGGPFTRLEVKENGKFRTLATDKLPLHEESTLPAAVVISANGSQLTVEVNGKQRFQVSDATFSQGKAGLMTFACSAEFSEFRLQVLP